MKIANPIGVLGENAACSYLAKKGYKILARNYREQYTEIDIIALYKSTLVFCEVKTRTSSSYGTPFEGISSRKLRALVQLGQYYQVTNPDLPEAIRFDAIGVTVQNGAVASIEHLENVTE